MSLMTMAPSSASDWQSYMFNTDGSTLLFSPTASSSIAAFPIDNTHSATINGREVKLMLDSKSNLAIFYEGKIISGSLALKKIIEISELTSISFTSVNQTLLNEIAKVVHYLCGDTTQSIKSNSVSLHKTIVTNTKPGEKSKEIFKLKFIVVEQNEVTKESDVTWDLSQGTEGVLYGIGKTVIT